MDTFKKSNNANYTEEVRKLKEENSNLKHKVNEMEKFLV
jgi:hypothetical protein